MLEDLPDDLIVCDGGDEAQRPPLTPGAARHIQRKDALEKPRPAPARRSRVGLLLVYTLPAWRRDDGAAQVAVGRQTATIAHQGGRASGARAPPVSPRVPLVRAKCPWCRPTTGG